LGLSIEQVDKLTGSIVGRPKSGSFRLSDVVGLDTTVNVCNNLSAILTNDESLEAFKLPIIMAKLMKTKGWVIKQDKVFTKRQKTKTAKQ